jgi:hypothetical protein
LAIQLQTIGDERRRAVAERDRHAEELARAPKPIVLIEPRRMPLISVGEPLVAGPSSFDSAAKVEEFNAILTREPWLDRAGLSKERLFQAALFAQNFLSNLSRVAPERERNAAGICDRCETWLVANQYGGHNMPLSSIVLAAMALGIPVEHDREFQPWRIFLGVK